MDRNSEVEEVLLKNMQNVDSYIYAAHFVGFDEKEEKLDFHYSARNTFFKDEKKFEEIVGRENWDRNSKKLQIVPPHVNSYYNQGQNVVFSLARNYFDTRGSVGREKYVGTLFLDVDIARMKLLFKTLRFSGQENYYVVDNNGYCLLSNEETVMGASFAELSGRLEENPAKLHKK